MSPKLVLVVVVKRTLANPNEIEILRMNSGTLQVDQTLNEVQLDNHNGNARGDSRMRRKLANTKVVCDTWFMQLSDRKTNFIIALVSQHAAYNHTVGASR